jgi:hypothetical protein
VCQYGSVPVFRASLFLLCKVGIFVGDFVSLLPPPPSHARCPRSTHTLSGGLQLLGVQVSGPRRALCYVELGRARGRHCEPHSLHLFTLPHNHLPSCPAPLCARSFLISGVFILILGMVFTSNGFQPDTFSYNAFTTLAAMFIVGSTVVFASLLVFEVRAVLGWSMHLSNVHCICRHSVYFPVLVDCTRRIFVIWGCSVPYHRWGASDPRVLWASSDAWGYFAGGCP